MENPGQAWNAVMFKDLKGAHEPAGSSPVSLDAAALIVEFELWLTAAVMKALAKQPGL
jgi:hypothetical protein